MHKHPSEKRSFLKGNNLLPTGSKLFPFRKYFFSEGRKEALFFPFRIDPFSEGRQKQFDRVVSPESVSSPFRLCFKGSHDVASRH